MEYVDGDGRNALICSGYNGGASEELIRTLVRLAGPGYLNKEQVDGWTAAVCAAKYGHADTLHVLLTLGADPKLCRQNAGVSKRSKRDAILTVLDRFELRIAAACCFKHFDDVHISSPRTLHLRIAALDPFPRMLHELHGVNGASHDLSRKILELV